MKFTDQVEEKLFRHFFVEKLRFQQFAIDFLI